MHRNIGRLRDFVRDLTRLVDRNPGEPALLEEGRRLLGALVAHDDWLPDRFAQPSPERYQQYLLHCDPRETLCVVSFVWGPGQTTPVHDHTVWGLIGMLRGAEDCVDYAPGPDGRLAAGRRLRLETGQVTAVSPAIGDIHSVANAFADRTSISIHVYGANIGAVRRHIFDPNAGQARPFVSGYSAQDVPNLWDRSAECPATPA